MATALQYYVYATVEDITHLTNQHRFPNDLALPPAFNLPAPFRIINGGCRLNGVARFRTYLNKKSE